MSIKGLMMFNVLLVVHAIIVLALIGLVLIQRSEGGGLGMGSSNTGFMSSRGTANTLTRATGILAALFFISSLALAYISSSTNPAKPVLENTPRQGTTAPAVPSTGGILDTLRQQSTTPNQ